jgi:hypothetical protein
MSTPSGNRRPAVRAGGRTHKLGLEALEPRCVCAAHAPVSQFSPPPPVEPPPAAKISLMGDVMSRAGRAEYHAEVADLKLTAGVSFTGPIAHMVAADDALDATDVTHIGVRIDWGDGQSTTGAVQIGSRGGYDIVGTARYSMPGTFVLTIDIVGPDGADATAIGKAEVPGPALPSQVPESAGIDVRNSDDGPAPHGADEIKGSAGSDTAATQTASRTPGDTSGGVPWIRLPDPRPLSSLSIGADHAEGQKFVAINRPEDRTPLNGLAEDGNQAPAGPEYLAAIDEAGDGFPAGDFTPIDVRPGIPRPIVRADSVDVDRPAFAVADPTHSTSRSQATSRNHGSVAAGDATPPTEEIDGETAPLASANRTPAQHTTFGFGWQCLSWFLALVFSDRFLTGGLADRSEPRISLRAGPPTKPPEAQNAGTD